MKKYKNIKRVCALDTMYTLFQYILISTEEEVNSTFFFWLDNIDEKVKEYFNGMSASIKPHMKFWQLLYYYYFISPIKWPFLLDKNVKRFGSDHLGFECFVCRKFPFELLEDGMLSYVSDYPYKWKSKRFRGVKSFLLGPLFGPKERVGMECTCIKIHLTGLLDAKILQDPKVEIHSMQEMWNLSSPTKRKKILDIFGLEDAMIRGLKGKKWLILTQPFSEDRYISEEEKIAIYKEKIEKIGDDNSVVIKTHPREATDYTKYFPNVTLLTSKAPIQLFSLCGAQFPNICTICSSAAFDFPYEYNLLYMGTDIHEVLYHKIANGRKSRIGALPTNIHLI